MTELVLGAATDAAPALEAVRSWKRLDAGGARVGDKIDEEQLWPPAALGSERLRRAVDNATLASLPRMKQVPLPLVTAIVQFSLAA